MDQKRKLILVGAICATVCVVVLALVILFFGTYKNKTASSVDLVPADVGAEAQTARGAQSAAAASDAASDANSNANPAANSNTNANTTVGTTAAAADEALSSEQIKRLLEEATEAYVCWVVGFGPTLDRDNDTFTVGTMKYCLVTGGKYGSIAEISAALHNIYTDACCADRCSIDDLYIERDGKLYGYELLGQGGDAEPGATTLTILSQSETECSVRVSYASEYANDHTYTLVKEDGKWKLPEPVNIYTGYPYMVDAVPWTN